MSGVDKGGGVGREIGMLVGDHPAIEDREVKTKTDTKSESIGYLAYRTSILLFLGDTCTGRSEVGMPAWLL